MDLWKTTIVIWSEQDPQGAEAVDLARDATDGDSFCSKQSFRVRLKETEDVALAARYEGPIQIGRR